MAAIFSPTHNFKAEKTMESVNPQAVLYDLKQRLAANLPLNYTQPTYNIDNVKFADDKGKNWTFQYEPQKGATTVLQAYVNGRRVRGFENSDQVVSFFYAKESAK